MSRYLKRRDYLKVYREQRKEEKAAYDRAYRERNRAALKAKRRAYYEKNKEAFTAQQKVYAKKNKGVIADRQRSYREKNREKLLAYDKERYPKRREKFLKDCAARHKNRLLNDPGYRLRIRLGTRLYQALKYQGQVKDATALELVGCTRPELMRHLQNKFKPGMGWNNYGPVWHVDHVRPCASFDLTDPEQQKACFHWTNLQPLFGEENIKKGCRYEEAKQ